MIVPRVKSQTLTTGVWMTKKKLAVASLATDAFASNAKKALSLFLPEHYFESEGEPDVTLSCLAQAPAAEWYRLTVTEKGATLEYADARGAINAVASLSQLILDGEVPACVIEDAPDYAYRGLMLDVARGIREPLQDLKDIAIHMALSKLNVLHLHLMDAESLSFASTAMPAVKGSEKRNGRQYKKEQIASLVELCTTLAIEIVPEIEIPSHASAVVKAYPQFACDVDFDNPSPWCVCPTSEELYGMYDALIREIAEMFPGKYIHIGTDELEFRSRPDLNQLCHWRECRKCQQFRDEKGLSGIREQFYYVVLRVYEMIKACGKTMMMWNDQIDISRDDCPIPKDVVIEFWRVSSKSSGPYEGCSMEGFVRQGYTVINAAFQKTYIDFDTYLNERELCTWTPVSWPAIYEEGHPYVGGGEMCAWEFGNREQYGFYDYTVVPNLPLFADRLWCAEPVEYTKEYRADVYKTVFGKKLQHELYPIFDGILPPRTDKALTHVDATALDLDYVAACIDELSEPSCGIYAKMRLEYIKLLHKVAYLAYDKKLANRQETEGE